MIKSTARIKKKKITIFALSDLQII